MRKCEYEVLEITRDTKVLSSHSSSTRDLTLLYHLWFPKPHTHISYSQYLHIVCFFRLKRFHSKWFGFEISSKIEMRRLKLWRRSKGGSRNYVYNDNKKELQLNKEISCCFYIGLSHVEKTSHWTLHILACSAHCFMMQAHE